MFPMPVYTCSFLRTHTFSQNRPHTHGHSDIDILHQIVNQNRPKPSQLDQFLLFFFKNSIISFNFFHFFFKHFIAFPFLILFQHFIQNRPPSTKPSLRSASWSSSRSLSGRSSTRVRFKIENLSIFYKMLVKMSSILVISSIFCSIFLISLGYELSLEIGEVGIEYGNPGVPYGLLQKKQKKIENFNNLNRSEFFKILFQTIKIY